MRGATLSSCYYAGNCNISIHAPRAGRDKVLHKLILHSMLFQSTRPVRGATLDDLQPYKTVKISIHAPRAGRDWFAITALITIIYFNPRAPCGARLNLSPTSSGNILFQSTRPVRGATS